MYNVKKGGKADKTTINGGQECNNHYLLCLNNLMSLLSKYY